MDSLNDFGMSVEAPMTASETPERGDRDPPGNDQEKRLRREIANSNERRRMQSINAGFQSLRNLLPHHEGEKLSKAAILQQTAEYIHQLEQEKTRLMTQNSQLMKRYNNGGSSGAAANATSSSSSSTTGNNVVASQSGVFSSPHSPSTGDAPPAIIKRRKTLDGSVESADEGIGSMSPDHNGEEYRNEVAELRRETLALRMQLERERRHRLSLEDTLSNLRHQNAGQVEEQQRMILRREEEEEQQRQQQILERQQQQQQQQIIFVHQQPSATVQPVHVKFEEKMQTAEENEVYLRVPTPVRNPHDDHRVRHNLNSIVEAIRQLEGDHLFADDRSSSSNVAGTRATVSPPRASPPGAMEVCPSSSPLSSSHPHNLHPHHQRAALSVQPTTLTYHCSPEVPLSLTSSSVTSVAHHEPGQTSNGILVRPAYHHQPPPPTVPVSTTVTSLKHHVLNRLARSGEMDEPINLEYRPVSRSPSPPPPSHCIQQQQVHHLHHHQIEGTSQAATIAQFHIQQQLRPGVIVVKHS